MRSLWMWAETTICGSFYLSAVAFVALGLAGIRDFAWLSGLKDFAPLLFAMAVALSYVIGTLIIRLEQPLFVLVRRRLLPWWLPSLPETPRIVDDVRVWQYGSPRLHRELDSQFSVLQLCKVMTLAVPILSMGIGFWLYRTGSCLLGFEAVAAGGVTGVAFLAAYREQRELFWKLLETAHAEVAKEHKHG